MQFSEEQQAFIQQLIDKRFSRARKTHADELKAEREARAALETELASLKQTSEAS